MAWFAGNDPTGTGNIEPSGWGRIMCEVLYAINERENWVGEPKTAWTAIGADPAVADADLLAMASLMNTLIEEARTAIETLVDDYKFFDAGFDKYSDLAELYNEAMSGGVTWANAVLDGGALSEATNVEELLKCTELLKRHKWIYDDENIKGYILFIEVAGFFLTDDAYDWALGLGVNRAVLEENTVEYDVRYDAYTDQYRDYGGWAGLHRLDTDKDGSVVKAQVNFDIVEDDTKPTWTAVDTVLRCRESTVGEWGDGGDWTDPAGDTIWTKAYAADETGSYTEAIDTDSVNGAGFTYFRFDVGLINPFDADPDESQYTINANIQSFDIWFLKTDWLYN